MSKFKVPPRMAANVEAHKQWVTLLEMAEQTINLDADLQRKVATGLRLKERHIPPEVLGSSYARYCNLINKMYDAYLKSIHLQRAPYMVELVNVLVRRMYELQKELQHIIVNDYFYIDSALQQQKMIPTDIQIVIPYHFPMESRNDDIEQVLQQMWADAVRRKKMRDRTPSQAIKKEEMTKARQDASGGTGRSRLALIYSKDNIEISPESSEDTIIPEQYIQTVQIQRHERYRQWFLRDFREKCIYRRTYFVEKVEVPEILMEKAATIIQIVCKEFMKSKREKIKEHKRDMLLGLAPDPFRESLNYKEENDKIIERRKKLRLKIKEQYLQELEKETTRLLRFKKNDQIDDITDEIRDWFKDWFYNYGFFPTYPYDTEGGTLVVVRGEYPTVDEQHEEDKRLEAMTKGKTREQIAEDKKRAKEEVKMKAQMAKEAKHKEEVALKKMRMSPESDPGYKPKESPALDQVVEVLQKYKASWSIYDDLTPEKFGDTIYGFMKPLLTEDIMKEIHIDCRKFVDELMRLDLKLLVKTHQKEYKKLGWKYPKFPKRKKPKVPPVPKPFVVDDQLKKSIEEVFDLGLITKPTTKFTDVCGDSKYGVYEYNVKDPDASFPLPGYGDIKNRLILSCVLGSGMQPGAPKLRAVMLLGPPRNGKSFLVDAVAGEMNAVKIDITPERFTAVAPNPKRVLNQVFVAARAFQPAVIFMKNVERMFRKKVPPEDKHLKAGVIKMPLTKLVKAIKADEKIIFIGTCSDPFTATPRPMLNIFDETILVPRTDYGTLVLFIQDKVQRIRSMPKDFPVQPLAQILQGYGFGVVVEIWNEVVCPERIVTMNADPLTPGEILEALITKGLEPLTLQEHQAYVDFFLHHSHWHHERVEYAKINLMRADYYDKQKKQKEQGKGKEKKEGGQDNRGGGGWDA